jgi:hypothetical protein
MTIFHILLLASYTASLIAWKVKNYYECKITAANAIYDNILRDNTLNIVLLKYKKALAIAMSCDKFRAYLDRINVRVYGRYSISY